MALACLGGERQLNPSSRHTGLIISEIMYRPAPIDGEGVEFIEIYNTEPVDCDLSGFRLSGDVDYVFGEGSVITARSFRVIAANPAALENVAGITGVLGPYSNRLDNSSGTVRLRNRQDALLLEVNYGDEMPWPVQADGAGHSLVLARPDYGEGDVRAWSAGANRGGSPGTADTWDDDALSHVVINEFLAHTDLPQIDFIELYNHGTQTVSLSGCVLTDSADTNKFVIPPGVALGAGGLVSFDQSELGFSLSMRGDEIYLIDTNGNRVIDAVRFGAQSNAVSTGRSPDGSPQLRVLASLTPGAANGGLIEREIVINEIMYHPISGDANDEYIELYNQGTNAVDMSHWRFTDGVGFTFPSGTVIEAGGYLVIAENATNLIARYARLNNTNTLGNYSGNLSDRGERIVLAKPDDPRLPNQDFVVMDSATYGDGTLWGEWADGGGSSLELVDPRSDNRLPMNWAGSDETQKATNLWTTVDYTGTIDNGIGPMGELRIFFLQKGECLIDDLEVSTQGSGLNYEADFESGLGTWKRWGNHIRSSLCATEGYQSAQSLQVRASGKGDTGNDPADSLPTWNRLADDLVSVPTQGQTTTIRAKARWLCGWPHLAIALKGFWLEAAVRLDVPPDLGSPGERNSRYAVNAGPAVSDVAHYPVLPGAHSNVVVTARVHDPDGVAAVELKWRNDTDSPTVTNSIVMNDSGSGGDGVAGDGVYSGTIPGQAAGKLVAFFVEAVDGAATAAVQRFPGPPPAGAPIRECLVRFGDTLPDGVFGTYRLWLTAANVERWMTLAGPEPNKSRFSNEPIDITFVSDDYRVIYNADARWRGGPWRSGYNSPEDSGAYSVNIPKNQRFLGEDELKIDQPGQVGGDATLQREHYCFWLADQLGIAASRLRYVHVYCNSGYRGIRHDLATPTTDLCRRWFDDPAPQVFRNQGWEGDQFLDYRDGFGRKKQCRYRYNLRKRRSKIPNDDYGTLYDLVDALGTADDGLYTQRVEALIDVRNWASYFALNGAVYSWDAYGYTYCHNVVVYAPQYDLSRLFIYDMDNCMGALGFTATDTAFFPSSAWPVPYRMFTHPRFRRVYWDFVRELVDGPMKDETTAEFLDTWHDVFVDNGVSPDSPATIKSWLSTRRQFILGHLAPLTNIAFDVTTQDFGTSAGPATISGVAPVQVAAITVNGDAYEVQWSTETGWTIEVPMTNGVNVLQFTAVDRRGGLVGSDTATVTNTGASVSPAGQLVINEIMYSPEVPEAEFIELCNLSATETIHLGGLRLDGVGYTFPYGTFIEPQGYAVVAGNLTVYAGTYTNAGVGIRPLSATASSVEPWGAGNVAASAIDPTDLNGDNEHVAEPFSAGPNWLSNETNPAGDEWIFVDLGAEYDLGEIRIWNYHENAAGGGDVSGRGVNSFGLWLAGAGATLPSGPGTTPFTAGNGWSLFTSGNLTEGPASDPDPGPIAPTDIFDVTGQNGIRYVGIDVGSRHGPDPYTTYVVGLAQIQVTERHAVDPAPFLLAGEYDGRLDNGGETLRLLIPVGSNLWQTIDEVVYDEDPPWPAQADGAGPSLQLIDSTRDNNRIGNWGVDTNVLFTPGAANSVTTSLPAFPLLWINEVMPSNTTTRADNMGDFDPWVELYNADTNTVALGGDGYYLSDDPTNLVKWAFPGDAELAQDARLLVWADDESDESTNGNLHAAFKLNSGGGCVVLTRQHLGRMLVVDLLTYDAVGADSSYGSYPDGNTAARQVFHHPTPGQPNSTTSVVVRVFINEWMADNDGAVQDPTDGHYEDWFELYNAGSRLVNLGGYTLSDSGDTSVIPGGTVISGKGYLLVWADAETDQNVLGQDLHVNFRLSKSGDAIRLHAPDGTLVDAVTFGPQVTDASEGRWQDGNATAYVMSPSTPGTTNRIFVITSLDSSISGATIAWGSEPGVVYRLDYTDDLTNSTWTTIGAVTAETTTAVLADTNAPFAARRFYRVEKVE